MSIEKTLKAPKYRYILNKMICRTIIPWYVNTANNNVLLLTVCKLNSCNTRAVGYYRICMLAWLDDC